MRTYYTVLLVSGCITATVMPLPNSPAYGFAPSQYSVTCTSQGQVCNRHAVHGGPFGRGWLNLTAPANHCSSLRYTITYMGFDGGSVPPRVLSVATTRLLGPGQSDRLGVDQRARSARISAVGVRGGCNEGRLASWSVEVEFEPYGG